MTMLRRLLIPLDGSQEAEGILVRLAGLIAREGTEVVLAHALHDAVPPLEFEAVAAPASREQMEGYLSALSQKLEADGVANQVVLRAGRPAPTILALVDELQASLIAISTHGASGRSRWLLGGVCEKVLRRSRTPVLTARVFERGPSVPTLERLPLEPYAFRRILAPVDGSPVSLMMLPRAAELAQACDGEVVLLHVYEDDYASEPSELPWLEAEREQLQAMGIRTRALIRLGSPVKEIERAAAEVRADVISIGASGAGAYSDWLLGSVAERVLRIARTPVLLVPSEG